MSIESNIAARTRMKVVFVFFVIYQVGCGVAPPPVDAPDSSALLTTLGGKDVGPDDEYVLTPAGRFHRSCVHHIPFGGTADGKGNVLIGGRVQEHYDNCRYRSFPVSGGSAHPIPYVNGWVEWIQASAFTNFYGFDWFNSLSATTTIPAAPQTSTAQTVFFFPALQPYANGSALLQPVIQWGPSTIGGGPFWTIAVWYIDASGNVHSSPLVAVSPGDTIVSAMQTVSNTCSAAGVCQWQLAMLRNGTLAALAVVQTNEAYRFVAKAVLEAWNLNSCSQFPNQSNLTYTNVTVNMPGPLTTNHNEISASLSWSSVVNPHEFFPNCNFGVASPNPHVGAVIF